MSDHPASIHRAPLALKYLAPDRIRALLAADPRVIIPVGTTEPHGPHLPMGSDTIIVERLADDLSAEFGVLRAPTIEYGVNAAGRTNTPGSGAVRRKTLHRFMNDLVGTWEAGGIRQFIILTAHGYDPHQEALSTLHTRSATVRTVDVFTVPVPEGDGELETPLLLYIDATLVDLPPSPDTTGRGARLYQIIYQRIATRVFGRE